MSRFNAEPYGKDNVHIERWLSGNKPSDPPSDILTVTLTYPQVGTGKLKYVHFNQESVRASDGVRLHYDYDRDGIVVCQPKRKLIKIEENVYDEHEEWKEVGFFGSWALDDFMNSDGPTLEQYEAADAEYLKARSKT